MNEYFDDYRVGEWMSKGIMKQVANIARSVNTSIASAGSVALLAVVLAATPMISVAHSSVVPASVKSMNTADSETQRTENIMVAVVDRLGKSIDDRISNFEASFQFAVDPELLALAELAITTKDNRSSLSKDEWAKRLSIGS